LEPKGQPTNLDHAQGLAESLGAELILLRVVTVIASDEAFFQQIQVEIGSSSARVKAEAEAQVGALERELRAQSIQAQGSVVVSDKSEAEAIVAYAESESCDLIVMPTFRQSTLSRWFLGSVAEKVRHRSSVPVLFVRAAAEGESVREGG
jgi:nucleotide-binding universal stress UspA family protein